MPIRNRGGTTTHTGQLDAGMHHEFVDAEGVRHGFPNKVGHSMLRKTYSGSYPSGDGPGTTTGEELRGGKGQFPRGKKSI